MAHLPEQHRKHRLL